MSQNKYTSEITYQNETDQFETNFFTAKENLIDTMYKEGKTNLNPNWIRAVALPKVECCLWLDRASAQEFIDFVIATAPTYNITLVSTKIENITIF